MNPAGDQHEQREFLLSQYLDGTLAGEDRRLLEQQLHEDAGLAAELAGLRAADRRLRTAVGPVPELDWEQFTRQVAARCRAADSARWRSRLLRVYAPLAAAAALAVAVTSYFFADRGGPSAAPKGLRLAMVTVERADAWRDAPDLGAAVASVSFNRTQAVVENVTQAPSDGLIVASAGLGPPADNSSVAEPTPYF